MTSASLIFHRLGRHFVAHAHEIVLGIVLEGSKIEVSLILAVLGALFLVFAIQMVVMGEQG